MASYRISEHYTTGTNSSNAIGLASVNLSSGDNYVFYYSSDNTISCLKGTDGATFSDTTVTIGDDVTISANRALCPLAAASWEDKEVRLYYVEDGTYLLKELCSADGINWRTGALDDSKFKLATGSGLTATFGANEGLKVFFLDAKNDKKFTEAYINTQVKVWKSRILQ